MIPEKIKIGCYVYDVVITDKTLIVDNKACYGKIQTTKQLIEIADNATQKVQGQEQTFWHEVIHGITRERGLDWGDNDELYTEELAKGLYALMKDNPFLLPGQIDKGGDNNA